MYFLKVIHKKKKMSKSFKVLIHPTVLCITQCSSASLLVTKCLGEEGDEHHSISFSNHRTQQKQSLLMWE